MLYRSIGATKERSEYLLNYLLKKVKVGDTFTDGVSTWERVNARKNKGKHWLLKTDGIKEVV